MKMKIRVAILGNFLLLAAGLGTSVTAGSEDAASTTPKGRFFENVDTGPNAEDIRFVDVAGRYFLGRHLSGLPPFVIEMDSKGRLYRDDDGDGVNDLAKPLSGFFEGSAFAVARAVNRRGVVVGSASNERGGSVAAIWVNGQVVVDDQWTAELGGAIYDDQLLYNVSTVHGINDAGRMLVRDGGLFKVDDYNHSWCALLSVGANVQHLVDAPVVDGRIIHRPECQALLLNNRGTVVAAYRVDATVNTNHNDPTTTGDFAYHVFNGPGTLRGLDGQPALSREKFNTASANDTRIIAINDLGQIVGFTTAADNSRHVVIWEPDGSVTDLGKRNGPQAINNLGEVLSGQELYLPQPNYGLPAGFHQLSDLGVFLETNSVASYMNDCGMIVLQTSNAFHLRTRVYRPIGSTCAPPESGDVVINLDSTQFISTEDEVQVQNATVSLYQQTGYLREQRPGESDGDYQAYLETQQGNRDPVDTKVIGPTDMGRVVFRDVPLIAPVEVGQANTLNWLYYTVEVSKASSEEFDFDAGSGTLTVHFVSDALANVSPSETSPPAEYDIALTPVDGIPRKKDLIDQLSMLAPVNYAPIENLTLVEVNGLESAGSISAEQRDWLRRAILAERVTRDGARFADEALTYMLRGLAALAGEVFDAATNFTRQDIVREKKRLQRIDDNPNVVNPFFDPQAFDGKQYIERLDVQKIIADGEDVKALKKIFSLLKPLMEAAAEATGMPAKQAKDITDNLMRALTVMFNVIEERTLGGALKDELKTIVEDAVKGTQPFLFDNAALFGFQSPVDVSYTGSTKGGLQHVLDRFSDWNQSDPAAYAADRETISNIEFQLGDEAAFVISLANALLEVAAAFDTAQRIFELGGKVFKQFEAAAKFSEVMKLAGNGGAFVVPAIFVYINAPDQVNEAAYRAFAATPPEVQ